MGHNSSSRDDDNNDNMIIFNKINLYNKISHILIFSLDDKIREYTRIIGKPVITLRYVISTYVIRYPYYIYDILYI